MKRSHQRSNKQSSRGEGLVVETDYRIQAYNLSHWGRSYSIGQNI